MVDSVLSIYLENGTRWLKEVLWVEKSITALRTALWEQKQVKQWISGLKKKKPQSISLLLKQKPTESHFCFQNEFEANMIFFKDLFICF